MTDGAPIRMLHSLSLLLILSPVVLCATASAHPVVDTKYGKVQGFQTSNNYVFYGIPYARPPVGSLRWNPPKDPAPWTPEVYLATGKKPGCPQYKCDILDPPMVCPKVTSEDCLYLNIWTPLGANSTSSLAVMVYLHGGNFVHMSATSSLYDGSIISSQGNIILVNIDYRLGALGFLVTGNKERDSVGNYGILDQRLALKWIGENIRAFGGDPKKVTLFGQSAGAQSVLIHLTSKESSPYFRNAIVESSPMSIPYKKYSEALLMGAHLAKLLNCTARDITCFRRRSADDIAYAQFLARTKLSSLKMLEEFEPWGPWVDGKIVTDEPVKVMDRGQFQRKPVIIGTTSEECRVYIYSAWKKPVDKVVYEAAVAASHPNHFPKILKEYPADDPNDERDTLSVLATDFIFGCSTRHAAREMLKYGISDVWMYVFDHAWSFPGWGKLTFCYGHVCHSAEVPFVFQTAGLNGFNYTREEIALSDLMITYWTNFAKYGNPQGLSTTATKGHSTMAVKATPEWPRFHSDNTWPYQHFKTPTSFVDHNYNGPFCDFWDSVGYND